MGEEEKAFEFDEHVAHQLNQLFQTEALQKVRKNYFDFFDVHPGEHVLDVGCGTGANAIALAERLEGDCRITGVDNSEAMLAIARNNLQGHPFRELIKLQHGDVHHLDFPAAHFDAAMVIQVLEYSKDPVALLREIRRVLKPGGKLFLADTDWDTIVWNSDDKELTRQIVLCWSDHEADGWQGRRLLELLSRAGYRDIRGDIYPIIEYSFRESDYSYICTKIIADYLIRSEKMQPPQLEAWVKNLQSKDQQGHFYFSLNRYKCLAFK
ncbi:MAG TPA: methyltransferase domain-containing protein [Acidobacteriota bacterium]|nr:methyltransferase domain-containing protein [Acidobacteriota bacterium]